MWTGLPVQTMKLAILIPSHDARIQVQMAAALPRIVQLLRDADIDCQLIHRTSSHVDENRNYLHRQWLMLSLADYCLWLDSDIEVVHPDLFAAKIIRKMKAKVPIAAGLYHLKDGSGDLAAKYDRDRSLIWAGAGCLLVSRALALKLPLRPWSSTYVNDAFVGEDVAFCMHVRPHADIADLDARLKHWGPRSH